MKVTKVGSSGRELCFRWAVLSPWVPFCHFPIAHPFHYMFVTATAAMCRIDCSRPKSRWAHNQEQVRPWSESEDCNVRTTSFSDNEDARSKSYFMFLFLCLPPGCISLYRIGDNMLILNFSQEQVYRANFSILFNELDLEVAMALASW